MTGKRLQTIFCIICMILFTNPLFSLEPLHEEELYDTSAQASPTVSIQYDEDHIVHYFNQNVVVIEPAGEISLSFKAAYYGDDGNYIALISPEPVKYIIEFDKHPYFPQGLGVTLVDLFHTGPDGRPLPQYREFDPAPPVAITPNTPYVRTKSAPVTISTFNNRRDIYLVGEGQAGEPDWEAAKESKNQLLSITQTYKMRIEVPYVYIWPHK
jgi:hypothetical protein